VNPAISDETIEVIIANVRGEAIKGKEIFVKLCLNIPSQSPHEATTRTLRGGPLFAFNTKYSFPIRRSKGLQRLCELRKANFEVYISGSLWRNAELVGRAYQPLVSSIILSIT